MLSQKSRYALKAMLLLATESQNKPLQCAEMAAQEGLPKKFLDAILQQLKNANLVKSYRGTHGGYQLAKPPQDITFGDILRVIDGPLALLPCVSKTAYQRCEDCRDEANCAIRHVFLQVRNSTSGILDNTKLSDVSRANHVLDYCV
jgi:Rrf2 family protein